MPKSYYRGYAVIYVNELWYFADTLQLVSNYLNRPCGKCNQPRTTEGHDACLGTLPGLMNACCGHGKKKNAYIQFLDSSTIHGKDAKKIIAILKPS